MTVCALLMPLPILYHFPEHGINPHLIPAEAKRVVEVLHDAGFEAYLVGGGVRDLCLGQTPKDFDIATSARPEQVKPLFRHALIIGRRFRLVHVRFKDTLIEVATFRSGDNASDDLIVQDNNWGTPCEDALRRDFTCNALFYDIQQQIVIDYVEGLVDLKNRRLRSIGEAPTRFRQDPVRMLRLLKFQARYSDMVISSEDRAALQLCRYEILKSSPPRLLEEMARMLESGYSAAFFQLLEEAQLLELLLPLASQSLKQPSSRLFIYLSLCDQRVQMKDPHMDRDVLFTILFLGLLYEKHAAKTGELNLHHLQEVLYEELNQGLGALQKLPRRMQLQIIQLLSLYIRMALGPVRTRLVRYATFPTAFHLLKITLPLQPALADKIHSWERHAQANSSRVDGESSPTLKKPRTKRRRKPKPDRLPSNHTPEEG